MSQCVICLLVLESGNVRVCRCSGGEIHDSCWIALQLARRGSSLCCPHFRQKIGRSRLSACAEKAIFFRFADTTDFPMAPLKISTTYVMPGCDEEVLLTVDRAYQQAVVRGCGRAVRA